MCVCVCVCVSHFSRVQPLATPWTEARQAPLSMGFSRQEYWSGLPCPPPGDLSDPGIKPASVTSTCTSRQALTISATWEAHLLCGRATNWIIIILQRVSCRSESSEPHSRLPSLGVWYQEAEPPCGFEGQQGLSVGAPQN